MPGTMEMPKLQKPDQDKKNKTKEKRKGSVDVDEIFENKKALDAKKQQEQESSEEDVSSWLEDLDSDEFEEAKTQRVKPVSSAETMELNYDNDSSIFEEQPERNVEEDNEHARKMMEIAENIDFVKDKEKVVQESAEYYGIDPELASTFRDRWLLLKPLGKQGAMGAVYEVYDLNTKVPCVMKINKLLDDPDENFGTRFKKEMKVLSNLQHQNLVKVFDGGHTDEAAWFTMLKVEGQDLGQEAESEESIPIDNILEMVEDVASGLEAMHENGVIHRDIKPDNILHGDNYQITDLGLLKLLSETQEEHKPTKFTEKDIEKDVSNAGSIYGTPQYMSPEQALGKPLDEKTDIWSLGLTLYEAMTKKKMFKGNSPLEVLTNIIQDNRDNLDFSREDLPDGLKKLLLEMIQPDPENRPTAKEIKIRIKEIKRTLSSEEEGNDDSMGSEQKSLLQSARDALSRMWK